MNKEELINFINSIDFEKVTNLVLTFYKKVPTRYNCNDEETRQQTITLNKDYESLINEKCNWIDRKIDDLYAGLNEVRKQGGKEE